MRLTKEFHKQNLMAEGNNFILVIWRSREGLDKARFELGFAVSPYAEVKEPLVKKEWKFTRGACALHTGLIENIGATMARIRSWMEAKKFQEVGQVLASYLDEDPSRIRPELLRIEVNIPVQGDFRKVQVQQAPVRFEPDMNSPINFMLEFGNLVEVLGENGEFYEIRVDGKTGFVLRSLLDFAQGNEIEKIEAPPEPPAPQAEKTLPPIKGQPFKPITPMPTISVGFGFYGTLNNSYTRGNLDTYFEERTGEPDRLVDDGSPAFWRIDGAVFLSLSKKVKFGAGVAYFLPAPHALWGTFLYYGGRDEILLTPFMMAITMPLKVDVMESITAVVCPELLVGGVGGYLKTSYLYHDYVLTFAVGFGLSGGVDFMFMKNMGVSFRMGFRSLKADLVWKDSTSSTGFSQPLLNNHDPVQADLSGSYMMIGIVAGF